MPASCSCGNSVEVSVTSRCGLLLVLLLALVIICVVFYYLYGMSCCAWRSVKVVLAAVVLAVLVLWVVSDIWYL